MSDDDEYDYEEDATSDVASDSAEPAAEAAAPLAGSDSESEGESDCESACEDELRVTKVDPVTRDANAPVQVIVVPASERITDNRLHKSEAAQVLAMRAQQIAKNAKTFIEGAHGLREPYAIAYRELFDRKCPLILRRQVGTGTNGAVIVEEWLVREMALPPLRAP